MIINAVTISDTGLALQPTTATYQHWVSRFALATNFNGKLYDSLQKIYTADVSSAAIAGMDTLYLAKNYGIIGYSSYPSHTIWSIQ